MGCCLEMAGLAPEAWPLLATAVPAPPVAGLAIAPGTVGVARPGAASGASLGRGTPGAEGPAAAGAAEGDGLGVSTPADTVGIPGGTGRRTPAGPIGAPTGPVAGGA